MAKQRKKWHLSRRAFLKDSAGGIGTVIGLPFLEAMLLPSKEALAQASSLRFAMIYIPNGFDREKWLEAVPGPFAGSGAGQLPVFLTPLVPIKDFVRVEMNLRNTHLENLSRRSPHSGPIHGIVTGKDYSIEPLQTARSSDQILREHLGTQSLHFAVENVPHDDTSGLPVEVVRTLSYSSPTVANPNRPSFTNQYETVISVFDSLFAGGSAVQSKRQAQLRRVTGASVVDAVRAQTQRLMSVLGAADRGKLNDYLDSIRTLENSIRNYSSSGGGSSLCTPNRAPFVNEEPPAPNFSWRMDRLLDIMALAFTCGNHRVATFLVGNELAFLEGFNSQNLADHTISHWADNPAVYRPAYNDQRRVMIDKITRFAQLLQNTPEGSGSVLDKTLILVCAGIGMQPNFPSHDYSVAPAILIGGLPGFGKNVISNNGGGARRPIDDLYRAIWQLYGMTSFPPFGQSNQILSIT